MNTKAYTLKPTFTPANTAAEQALAKVRSSIAEYPTGKATREKNDLFLASFLAQAQRVLTVTDSYLAIPRDHNWWTPFELGRVIAMKATSQLEAMGFISFLPETGFHRVKWKPVEGGKWRKLVEGEVTLYGVDASLAHLEGFWDAEWADTRRPTIQIGSAEITSSNKKKRQKQWLEQQQRKAIGKAKPKDNPRKYGAAYSKAHREVSAINSFMREHPLAFGQADNSARHIAASVTRIFHNSSMTQGGRYYGLWTNMGSQYRLLAQIDGEPVVEIDLNASQPTLFSAMLGIPMLGGLREWSDLYAEVLQRSVLIETLEANDDDADTRRKKLKQVATECIGAGNPLRTGPAKGGKLEFSKATNPFQQSEYSVYVMALMQAVPALQRLDKKKAFDGAGFISYHESEMMRLTLQRLIALGVPAYPIHDCLLVKKSDQEVATNTYRQTIRDYVFEHSKRLNPSSPTVLTVPVSIEERGREKVRLAGGYY